MTKRITVLDFKTVDPLFSQERDGIKPFTERLVDSKDSRFRIISKWEEGLPLSIRITNLATGENFTRKLIGKRFMRNHELGIDFKYMEPNWLILYLGDKVEDSREDPVLMTPKEIAEECQK
uniref:Uncharacterized protein n=1 Tax=viral metagenome TaxID=1070528 RepID=A0A6M3LPC5_9ZZZZ